MAEKGKQLKVGHRVSDSFGRKGTVVRFGKQGAVAVKWDKKNKKRGRRIRTFDLLVRAECHQ